MSLVFSILLAHTLAVMSPGPDFVMILKNSLTYSRRSGYFTAVGFGAGAAIHLSYCFTGIAILLKEIPLLYQVLKMIGALYLCYLGIQCFRAKPLTRTPREGAHFKRSDFNSFKDGLFTNLLNPKATLFLMGLIGLSWNQFRATWQKGLVFFMIIFITIFWFVLVARFFSIPRIQRAFLKIQRPFNWILGIVFILLAITLTDFKFSFLHR